MEPAKEIDNEKMNEIWRPVRGYEGLYEVSNLGRVRSLDRMVPVRKAGGKTFQRIHRGAIKKTFRVRNGYLMVHLNKNGEEIKTLVHRMVAEAFLPKTANKTVVNHLDYCRQNNRADNLEWTTSRDNIRYSRKNMRTEHRYPAPQSGIKHIYRTRNSWEFRIRRVGMEYSRTFTNIDAAIAAKEAYFHGKDQSLDQNEHYAAG